jgi:hypothetical protein
MHSISLELEKLPMLARVYSCAVIYLDGVVVEADVDNTTSHPVRYSHPRFSGCHQP